MGKASLSHSITKAKQDRKDLPEYPISKVDELQEAQGQLQYYKSHGLAIAAAVTRLKEDYILCEKNAKLWQSRISKLEAEEGLLDDN